MSVAPTHPVVIDPHVYTGHGIKLRPVTLDDCTPHYVAWLNDRDVTRFLETRHSPQTLDTVKAFVASMIASKDSHLLAIIEASTGRHIGNVKLGPINPHHLYADISYFIGAKDCWRKGYGQEAVKAATWYGFTKLKLMSIRAGAYQKNEGSIRLLKRVGFKERGTFPFELCVSDESRDAHVMLSVTLPEWKSKLT